MIGTKTKLGHARVETVHGFSGSPTFGVDEKSFKPIFYKNTKRHMNISYAKI